MYIFIYCTLGLHYSVSGLPQCLYTMVLEHNFRSSLMWWNTIVEESVQLSVADHWYQVSATHKWQYGLNQQLLVQLVYLNWITATAQKKTKQDLENVFQNDCNATIIMHFYSYSEQNRSVSVVLGQRHFRFVRYMYISIWLVVWILQRHNIAHCLSFPSPCSKLSTDSSILVLTQNLL